MKTTRKKTNNVSLKILIVLGGIIVLLMATAAAKSVYIPSTIQPSYKDEYNKDQYSALQQQPIRVKEDLETLGYSISREFLVSAKISDMYFDSVDYNTIHDNESNTYEDLSLQEEFSESNISVIDTIHVVKSGDNYWNIAIQYYNHGGYCYALCKYNGITTDTILHPGDEVVIPSLDDPEFSRMTLGLAGDNITNENISYTYADAYYHGTRTPAAVDINIPTSSNMRNFTGEVDTSSYKYLGEYHLTGYGAYCSHCNGGNTTGIGAAGVKIIPGYSIAMSKDIPFGTTVYIEGYGYYVVEDRGGGIGPGRIDIACLDHDSAYETVTDMYNINVWIVE